MNVASLELCKELYELSGWDETGFEYSLYDKSVIAVDGASTGSPKFVVAYPLGYLLRKLPKSLYSEFKESYVWKFVGQDDEGWQAGYQTVDGFSPNGYCEFADTPEDAAARLAVELLKSGVLTSEHSGSKGASS